jgi:hypothetical protein
MKARAVALKCRPVGMPKTDDFEIIEIDVAGTQGRRNTGQEREYVRRPLHARTHVRPQILCTALFRSEKS